MLEKTKTPNLHNFLKPLTHPLCMNSFATPHPRLTLDAAGCMINEVTPTACLHSRHAKWRYWRSYIIAPTLYRAMKTSTNDSWSELSVCDGAQRAVNATCRLDGDTRVVYDSNAEQCRSLIWQGFRNNMAINWTEYRIKVIVLSNDSTQLHSAERWFMWTAIVPILEQHLSKLRPNPRPPQPVILSHLNLRDLITLWPWNPQSGMTERKTCCQASHPT